MKRRALTGAKPSAASSLLRVIYRFQSEQIGACRDIAVHVLQFTRTNKTVSIEKPFQYGCLHLCEWEWDAVSGPGACLEFRRGSVFYSSRRTSSGFCPSTRWLATQPVKTASAVVSRSAATFQRK